MRIESKVLREIKEYFWDFGVSSSLVAYAGTGEAAADCIVVWVRSLSIVCVCVLSAVVPQERSSKHELMTSTDSAPFAATVVEPPVEVDLSYLFCSVWCCCVSLLSSGAAVSHGCRVVLLCLECCCFSGTAVSRVLLCLTAGWTQSRAARLSSGSGVW